MTPMEWNVNHLEHAFVDTPTPGPAWLAMTREERMRAVDLRFTQITVKDARADGQVIVELWDALPANERGTRLLDYEECLKDAVDPALVVWLETQDDKNSLRKLRGIEIKS